MDMQNKLNTMLLFLCFVGLALFIYIGDTWRHDDWFAGSRLTGTLVAMMSIIGYMNLVALIMNLYQIRLSAEVEE